MGTRNARARRSVRAGEGGVRRSSDRPAEAAAKQGMELLVVKHHEAKRGFVLLPRRWVVERSFAWAARFRRLASDYERLTTTFAGYHWLAFVTLMLGTLFRKS
jgi:Transposase and inactivated derivatives